MSASFPPGYQPPGQVPMCTQHPFSPAVARCVSCGRQLCPQCRVVIDNRNYCVWCAGVPVAVPPVVARPSREIVFPNAPWGVGEAILIFVLAFVAASAFTFFLYQILASSITSSTALFLVIFVSSVTLYAFLLGGTYYSVKVRHGSSLSALGFKTDGLGKGVASGLLIGIPLFIGALGLAYLTQFFMEPTRTDYISRSFTEISEGGVNPGLLVLFCFTLVVLAPVCEEIFFRGYMYPALRNRMGMQPAMILNGVLFAAAHFDLVGFLPRFLLAYGLCYIYEKNRTLGAPIAGHALYNGLILFLSGFWRLF